eukprot:7099591-Pyramimonas_sp.AAC.1
MRRSASEEDGRPIGSAEASGGNIPGNIPNHPMSSMSNFIEGWTGLGGLVEEQSEEEVRNLHTFSHTSATPTPTTTITCVYSRTPRDRCSSCVTIT